MEDNGWTSFCRSGHIVDVCPPGVRLRRCRIFCPICGDEVVGNVPGWRNVIDDYPVPVLPVRKEQHLYKDEAGELVETREPVYDVTRLVIFADK